VETHAAGFACALARELSEQLDAEIHWKVYARSGYTLRRLYEKVLPAIEEKSVDLIVLGMGGNEAFKMNTFAGFRRDMQAVIDWLRSRFGSTVPIAFPNMPPIKEFPAFTSVLKFTLGNKVEYFGEELAGLIAGQPQLYYDARVIRLADWREELDLDQDPSAFFSDGVHPSGLTYQLWGREMAKFLLRQPGLRL
ncbi:MAG: SGNH/GDSL hydrolase family protein, partial [Bacteroidota bacterium]